MATKHHKVVAEPMALMRKRERMIDELPPHQKPNFNGKHGRLTEHVARLDAEWNLSDPFAYGRTILHMRQGYVEPTVLAKSLAQHFIARDAARRRLVEAAEAKANG